MRAAAVVLGLLWLATPGSADDGAGSPISLQTLFPQRADLFVERLGIVRLPLPAEVLKVCHADLSDLRIIINTHLHIDHAGGNAEMQEASGAGIHIHKADAAWEDGQVSQGERSLELDLCRVCRQFE